MANCKVPRCPTAEASSAADGQRFEGKRERVTPRQPHKNGDDEPHNIFLHDAQLRTEPDETNTDAGVR
jgi:hypothetical protein